MSVNELYIIAPEMFVAALALLVLTVDLMKLPNGNLLLGGMSGIGLLVGVVLSLSLLPDDTRIYDGIFVADEYALFFKIVFLSMGAIVVAMSYKTVETTLERPGEYYALMLFSVLGMMVMASARDILVAYVALELMSFSLYILVSYSKNEPIITEASTKYILLGAFSSAILLYGMSLMYGVTQTTSYAGIVSSLEEGLSLSDPLLLVSLVLLLAGFGFKLAAVPFHMWAPDIYQAAPSPVTGHLAVASKAAAFAVVLRLFAEAFAGIFTYEWALVIGALAAVTMTLGNVVAIMQKDVKRMLAYSSVGQVGYLLMPIAALGMDGVGDLLASGLMFHLIGYGLTNFMVFACVSSLEIHGKHSIADYAGLGRTTPFIGMALTAGLFSLAGLPFFAGFASKFYLFTVVADVDGGIFIWLVALAIVNSLISLYYYLVIIREMYMVLPDGATRVDIGRWHSLVVMGLLLAVVAVGLYPEPIVSWAQSAAGSISF
tara:strand:- start:2031 stop:3494 length:1464 start_codon:yes stop_codon:yes gene_type:complete